MQSLGAFLSNLCLLVEEPYRHSIVTARETQTVTLAMINP
jgi:hypothetical protein